MACRSTYILLALVLPYNILALQVAPNSPCSSVCIDSTALDASDPNSSNTEPSDIVCEDADFTNTVDGSKWKQCMSCLQNSTFSQGSESDQYWFIHNLRYSFDFCVFGFLDGTGSGSNPCETSSACGPLRTSLEHGNLSTTDPEFGYCDDGAVAGSSFNTCLDCVGSGGNTQYVANALVALQAGCLQRPSSTEALGLNGSIFSARTITIVDPATLKKSPETAPLSTPAIAGIVAGAVVLVVLVSACILIRCRKRRNRAAIGTNPQWSKTPKSHKRKSSFSFRCRKILASPMSPKFFRDDLTPVEEHPPYGSLDAMATSQVSGVASTVDSSPQERYHIESKNKPSRPAYEQVWSPQFAPPEFQTIYVPEEEHKQPDPPMNFSLPEKKSLSEKRSLTIDTTLAPPKPARQSPKADTFSVLKSIHQPSVQPSLPPRSTPYRPTSYTSTTSAPSQAGSVKARGNMTTMSSQGSGYPSLTTPCSASPLLKQKHGWPSPPRESPGGWFPPPPPPPGNAPRAASSSSPFRGARKTSGNAVKKAKRESGSPVETRQIQISFPGPPQR